MIKNSEDLTRAFIGYITGSLMTQAALIEWVVAFFLSRSRSSLAGLLADWLLPDAGEELSVLFSHQDVGQHRGQPLNTLFSSVLFQHTEESLLHFRLIAQDLFHLRKAQR